ncbi:MAG: Cna B-type domain-containing protein [Clostridia bacterium]|nr:Cna B-type domain-containing protein [Clostridia bacterium]
MADQYDPMKDPTKHVAPEKTIVDKVIELALGAGGGVVTLLSGLLAAVLILYSGYVLYDSFATERAASSNAWDLLQFKPEIIDDYETPLAGSDLKEVNQDYRAWLTVYGTDIDYPVVQGPNDTYYAAIDIYGRPSLTGAIYLAAANSPDFSDSYNVIYGHHMDSGAMFGALDGMNGRETGVIITENDIYDVQFFAVVQTDAYEGNIYSVGNRMNSVLDFLRSGGEGGVGVGTTVTYFDESALTDATKIVALSTCANANTSGRLVIFGTMTKRKIMTEITIAKVWDDADNQDGIRPERLTVTLSSGDRAELTAENGWTATLSVPKFDNRGEIRYTWTEEAVQGYEMTSSVYDEETRTTTLTNHHTPAVTSVSVEKRWEDDDNRDAIRPESVTAVLSNGMTAVLNEENGWTATIANLPAYENGQEIAYTWTEETVEGYELRVDGNQLINTHRPATTSLSIRKEWNDGENQDGLRPETVQVNLYGNDELMGSVTLRESNGWSARMDGLYVNEAGQPIEYRWEEEPVAGYTLSSATDGTATTLINTHTPETIDLTVSKIWDDNDNQDGMRPRSLNIELSNGRRVTLSEGNGWSETITGLPRFSSGEEITYSWTEEEVSGYEQTSSVTTGNSTVITNRHETDTTVATVIKVWDDDENRDGLRPESITVSLSNGEERVLNAENNWTATITGLPANENGQPIAYSWTEEAIAGYTSASTLDGTTTTLTNSHEIDTVDLIATKVWADNDDQDGLRPRRITITLKENGEAAATFSLSAENNWTAAANGMPRNAEGRPIAYTWDEEAVAGYELTTATDGLITTLTNTHRPETTSLTVTKVWEDGNDQDGIRPEGVRVTLSNGTQVSLNAANGWTATVEDLPVYEGGEAIAYTWTEENVAGYTGTSATAGAVTTLTNIHLPETTALTVTKVWEDDNDRDAMRPSTLAVNLMANGTTIRSATLNAINGWTATFEELPVNVDGAAIEYTWNEETVDGYESAAATDGTTTTFTNTHTPETVTLAVNKIWVDEDNRDGMRPASLSVMLRGDDETERTVTLSEENGWSAAFEVPARESGREINYSWTEEAIAGYTSTQTVSGNTTTFTNTHEPARTTRSIAKVWDDGNDQDGIRPNSLTVYLLANNEPVETITLNAGNNWSYTAEDLYTYENGSAVSYSWREAPVAGYPNTTSATNGTLTTFTNTHVPELVAVRVQKVWDDEDETARPASLNMVLSGSNGETRMVTLSAANGWTATVNGLPRTANGAEVTYTWTEPAIAGYTQTSVVTTGTTTVFTNTRIPPEISTTEYNLTINYRYLNGDTAAETYTETYREGEAYSVASPSIAGYRATLVRVAGTMPGRNVEYTVLYLPNDGTIIIEDLDTPLGLGEGQVFLNIDDCLE